MKAYEIAASKATLAAAKAAEIRQAYEAARQKAAAIETAHRQAVQAAAAGMTTQGGSGLAVLRMDLTASGNRLVR